LRLLSAFLCFLLATLIPQAEGFLRRQLWLSTQKSTHKGCFFGCTFISSHNYYIIHIVPKNAQLNHMTKKYYLQELLETKYTLAPRRVLVLIRGDRLLLRSGHLQGNAPRYLKRHGSPCDTALLPLPQDLQGAQAREQVCHRPCLGTDMTKQTFLNTYIEYFHCFLAKKPLY